MLQKGVYRTIEAGLTIEEHGGAKIKHYMYWFLCFYLPKKYVGLYGTSTKNYLKPYLENRIELKGKITVHQDDRLEFYIYNKDTGVNILYNGRTKEDQLYLKYYHENKPEEVFDDVFKYIGTGESKA